MDKEGIGEKIERAIKHVLYKIINKIRLERAQKKVAKKEQYTILPILRIVTSAAVSSK